MAHTEDTVLQVATIGADPDVILVLEGQENLMSGGIEGMQRSHRIGHRRGEDFEREISDFAPEVLSQFGHAFHL